MLIEIVQYKQSNNRIVPQRPILINPRYIVMIVSYDSTHYSVELEGVLGKIIINQTDYEKLKDAEFI